MEVSLGKECIVILLLIFGNGVFSLLEMSIVSCHQPRLEAMAEEGSKSAKIVLKLRENPNKMFSAVQFGITLMGLLTGVYGGTEMAGPMSQYVAMIPGLEPYAYSVSLTTIVAVITYLTIILGEIVPKRIAINKPEAIACFLARPMLYFCTVSTPLIWFLSASTALVTKVIGMGKPEVQPVTEEEIKILLEQGAELGAFEKEEPELVDRVFRLADMNVSDIMTNRTQVDWIDVEDPDETIMNEMIAFNHIHLPVGRGSLDEFLGMVSVNMVFQKYYDAVHSGKTVTMKSLVESSVQKPVFVPESMDIMKVVPVFREHSVHEAAVLDEYGNFSGLLTLHDILEELVGSMPSGEKEKKENDNRIVQRGPNEWLMEGLLTIEEFKDFFDLEDDLPGEEDDLYKTLAGFVTYGVGRIPKETDTYVWNEFTFEVMDMDNLRVDKILVTRQEPEEKEEDTEE
ncbi:hemolysin family protein [Megasphaera butyrica]|uniref:hemolysin family protein n=1 Tax=Megasphaera TaxID=906 RepID=UPI0008211617|nr:MULTISPECIES: hemolysin family protein [Megasphaera]MCU6713845.1 hemolysin family protein [Megasphaera butyrica]NJE35406.1 HlyC/CorC family transporter [Megasphaera sp. SW808]SCH20999.1 Putative Mg2+ and Co2+ transporter CorB [uncultured Megasphaera sp.]SCI90216.1 Putative Mg2+ and Co2+ transporter CorB [uncultured Ruminococcus sp.]